MSNTENTETQNISEKQISEQQFKNLRLRTKPGYPKWIF